MVGDGLPAGEECEGVVVEAAEFFPDGDELPGVVDGAVELPAVADDAVVLHQPVYVLRGHLCYFFHVEVVEGFAVSFAFAEDGNPGESCLCAFEHEEFEEGLVVGDGPPPFFVVVFGVQGVCSCPAAA